MLRSTVKLWRIAAFDIRGFNRDIVTLGKSIRTRRLKSPPNPLAQRRQHVICMICIVINVNEQNKSIKIGPTTQHQVAALGRHS
jgi:hypothetical protein